MGEGAALLCSIPLTLLWLSEAELGFLKSHYLCEVGKERARKKDFSKIRSILGKGFLKGKINLREERWRE